MKAVLRSPAFQGALAYLLWFYLDLMVRTIRWTRINEDAVAAQLATGRGAIGCFWHEAVPLSICAKPAVRGHDVRIMISLSPDGEFVARAMRGHGMGSIRGSSGKKSDRAKAKGAVAALREALALIGEGGVVVIAPDGPRGPARTFTPGAVQIAKRTGTGVFFLGLAATPKARAKTWDRMQLPRPFGRGCIVWDGPHFCPPDADDAAIAALALDWTARLNAAFERAESEVA